MFIVGCQIIGLDWKFLEVYTIPIHVPGITEDIFTMILFMENFWCSALYDTSVTCYDFLHKQLIIFR